MKWASRIILALGATGLCLARAPMSDAQATKRMKDAQTFAERGQLRQAAASIETSLRSRPNDIDALAMLCAVRTADGDAVELEPVDQGLVHKRFREAADACKRAAAVGP
jgi:cytochrome c-type biogenesis protein CcmH/NrfG